MVLGSKGINVRKDRVKREIDMARRLYPGCLIFDPASPVHLNRPAQQLSASTLLKSVSELKNTIVGCEDGNLSGLKSLDKL